MTTADDRVLEFLQNEGNREIVANPRIIAENIDFNAGYVRQRMAELLDAGLVEYHDEAAGIYAISDQGRKYLTGELDGEDLERDDH